MKINETVTFETFDDGWDADQYNMKWKCPVCGHKNKAGSDSLYESISSTNELETTEICSNPACEREFKIVSQGEITWSPGPFEVTLLSEEPPE